VVGHGASPPRGWSNGGVQSSRSLEIWKSESEWDRLGTRRRREIEGGRSPRSPHFSTSFGSKWPSSVLKRHGSRLLGYKIGYNSTGYKISRKKPFATHCCERLYEVGDTGLEPVTPSLSTVLCRTGKQLQICYVSTGYNHSSRLARPCLHMRFLARKSGTGGCETVRTVLGICEAGLTGNHNHQADLQLQCRDIEGAICGAV
jgi:hypothetical protein